VGNRLCMLDVVRRVDKLERRFSKDQVETYFDLEAEGLQMLVWERDRGS
jgi:hypothetical protein